MVAAYNRLFGVLFIVSGCGLAIAACSDDTSDPGDDRDGAVDDGGGESGRGGSGGGSGRGGTGGRGGSGAENECDDASANDCDEHATCNDTDDGYECECDAPAYEGDGESCECADGYSEVEGECVGEDGAECASNDHCENGNCVDGICCASACDDPPKCQLAEGATCADGATCVYVYEEDGTECDDENVCTEDDVCEDGLCAGNGEDVPDTTSCGEPDACSSTGYHCAGNGRGDCISDNPLDCTSLSDTCHEGICDPEDGCVALAAENGTACDDGDACSSGETCTDEVCGGASPTVCDDSNPCTDDACSTTLGCTTTANDTATCSDSDMCTTNDHCAGGLCVTDPVVCTGMDNVCNLGVCDPNSGNCTRMPRPDTTTCDDTDSCTATDLCNNGTCTGTGNACGANATACAEGSPNDCTCATDYVDNNAGQCVPLVDECAPGTNPCDANATCVDPTNATGDVDCTCNPGYSGNGTTCTDINECTVNGNPCGAGRGTCTQGAPLNYTCACGVGFTSVDSTSDGVSNPTCSCDMDGTFAVRIATDLSWTNVTGIADGTATVHSWQIRRHTYEADGTLIAQTTQCGATTPDLCGTFPFQSEAIAQYVPNHIWNRGSMPVGTSSIEVPSAYAGRPFVTANTAVILGMSLTNPLGPWPALNQNVGGGGGTQTNGAIWVDHDGDGPLGMTSLNVTGAVSDDNMGEDDPPENYAATSPACGGDNYRAWPGLETGFGGIRRVTRFYSASRLISRFDGAFDSCDRIDGAVRGPADGNTTIQSDLRFYGCVDDSDDSVCGPTLVDFYDDTPQTQDITGATFVMLRVANTVTCDDVRAMAFPAN